MRDRSTLEARLAAMAGRTHAVLLGHANTALYVSLKYLQRGRGAGEVIVPPIVCPSVVQTIICAGFAPVYADVSLPSCTIDVTSAVEVIGPNTRAILPVHIFGHSADMTAVAALAKQHGIWLIEDAAQSIGAHVGGRPHGGWGEVSLYSFGSTKINAAGGGGALLCDDEDLHAFAIAEAAKLAPLAFDTTYRLLSLSHRNLIHCLMDALRVRRSAPVWKSFANLAATYDPLYVHSFPDDSTLVERIDRELDALAQNLAERRKHAHRYHTGLTGLGGAVQLPDASVCDGTVWRYTLLVSDDARTIAVTDELRGARLNASNHYWSVAHLLHGRRDLPNADYASPRLLNLWVEPRTPLDDIDRAIDIIRRTLAGPAE